MRSFTKKFFGFIVTSLLMLSMLNIIFTASADPDLPTFSVDPSLIVLPMGTDTFDVNITISDLSVDYRAVGIGATEPDDFITILLFGLKLGRGSVVNIITRKKDEKKSCDLNIMCYTILESEVMKWSRQQRF